MEEVRSWSWDAVAVTLWSHSRFQNFPFQDYVWHFAAVFHKSCIWVCIFTFIIGSVHLFCSLFSWLFWTTVVKICIIKVQAYKKLLLDLFSVCLILKILNTLQIFFSYQMLNINRSRINRAMLWSSVGLKTWFPLHVSPLQNQCSIRISRCSPI